MADEPREINPVQFFEPGTPNLPQGVQKDFRPGIVRESANEKDAQIPGAPSGDLANAQVTATGLEPPTGEQVLSETSAPESEQLQLEFSDTPEASNEDATTKAAAKD